MVAMAASVREIRERYQDMKIFIGGAPVTHELCKRIGADGYFANPTDFTRHLRSLVSRP